MLAALAALLYRYTGQTEFVIGHQRRAGEVELVRMTLDPAASAAQLTEEAGAALRRAAGLGPVTVAELAVLRGERPCHGLLCHDVPVEPLAELAVSLTGALAVPDGLDEAAHARLSGHLTALLTAAAEQPATPVGELPMLSAAEQRQALLEWNATEAPVPPLPVHELIAMMAVERPEHVAVVDRGRQLTFAELDADANRLANHLVSLGGTAEDRIAVLLERGVWSVLAQLAIFKIGATVVLLDPDYPDARVGFMVDDSRTIATITRIGLLDRIGGERIVAIDGDEEVWRSAPALHPGGTVDDESVSHVAFTSGSTGAPKAVLLRHGPFRNTVEALVRQCGITGDSRGTWVCSPGVGLVEVDLFPVLAAGATVVIPDAITAASATALRDWLVAERITHTLQPTAMAERLWALPWPAGCDLRSMRVAGERVRGWPSPGLPFEVLNVYGSAEANVVATCDLTAVAARLTEVDRAVPVGRPVPNVRAYVLDRRRQPVPPGVLGELYVSGAGLSRGYLNRPTANSEKFLVNPIEGDPYPVLYRTGDAARYWPDGLIEVVGRLDDEVKIHGHRVHLGEVESVLAAQPGVRRCAVVTTEDVPGEHRLIAYVEPDRAAPPLVRELRRSLRRVLPPSVLPADYVVCRLPSTADGQIDRAALPAPRREGRRAGPDAA
jgi:amino acid adenylation domain-containing protein